MLSFFTRKKKELSYSDLEKKINMNKSALFWPCIIYKPRNTSRTGINEEAYSAGQLLQASHIPYRYQEGRVPRGEIIILRLGNVDYEPGLAGVREFIAQYSKKRLPYKEAFSKYL